LTVEVKGLRKSFGRVTALRDVSFSVQKGAFDVVLGPSGCGKTTLLRCIAGVETPDLGEILINGEVVFSTEERINVPPERRQVGMVYQSYALWPHMTVFENVAFPLKVRHMSEQEIKLEVKKILELLNIGETAERYPSALSGGQQQRVALARAMVYQPPLILLDEPLSGLDEPLRMDIARDLKAVHKQLGADAVYVTHNREESFWLGDHILVMLDGSLIAEGTGESLLKRPPNTFVAKFLSDMVLIEGRLLNSTAEASLVTTEIGNLICKDGVEYRELEKVYVGINVRQIEIATNAEHENVFEGKILDKGGVQNDGSYRYPVLLGNKTVFIWADRRDLMPGSRISLRLPPEKCVIVPAQ